MLNSAEKTVNPLEAKSEEMTQYIARRSELLEDTNLRGMEGRIMETRSTRERGERGWRSSNI